MPHTIIYRTDDGKEFATEAEAIAHEQQLAAGPRMADDGHGNTLPVMDVTHGQMHQFLEYSASIPTGKTIGKRWKRRLNNAGTRWVIGGYEELSPEDQLKWPGQIAILWWIPSVDGGEPGTWVIPA